MRVGYTESWRGSGQREKQVQRLWGGNACGMSREGGWSRGSKGRVGRKQKAQNSHPKRAKEGLNWELYRTVPRWMGCPEADGREFKAGLAVCVSCEAVGADQSCRKVGSRQDEVVCNPSKRGNGVENVARSDSGGRPQHRMWVTREWGPQGVEISKW